MPSLKIGDRAPDFQLTDHTGSNVHLSNFLGCNHVVLAFYVLANTPTWSHELKAYQAGFAKFEKANTKILGISVNKSETNASFAKKLGVTFPLLCDTDKKVSKSFGVLSFFRVARRATFLVDKEGIIRHVDEGSAAASPAGALEAAEKLRSWTRANRINSPTLADSEKIEFRYLSPAAEGWNLQIATRVG